MINFLTGFLDKEFQDLLTSAVKKSQQITEEEKDNVLIQIMKLGSAYPSEIAYKLVLDKDYVYKIFKILENEERIFRIDPDRYNPQIVIAHRIADMQSMGVRTYEHFINFSWYALREQTIFDLAKKYKGRHLKCHSSYLRMYPAIKLNLGGVKND